MWLNDGLDAFEASWGVPDGWQGRSLRLCPQPHSSPYSVYALHYTLSVQHLKLRRTWIKLYPLRALQWISCGGNSKNYCFFKSKHVSRQTRPALTLNCACSNMSFACRKPSRHRGLCLPYCCAGSQRISDSDISDYEVDDGIGVVPPGAWWRAWLCFTLSAWFRCPLPASFRMLNWRSLVQKHQHCVIPWWLEFQIVNTV